jgi:hypothetical protein
VLDASPGLRRTGRILVEPETGPRTGREFRSHPAAEQLLQFPEGGLQDGVTVEHIARPVFRPLASSSTDRVYR